MSRNRNRVWRLVSRPKGRFNKENFVFSEEKIPVPGNNEVKIRTLYVSLDPTHRIWMSDIDQYMPPIELGEIIRSGSLGIVEESRSSKYNVGDIVLGLWGWQDYSVVKDNDIRHKVVQNPKIPLTAWISVLGSTGITAWIGLHLIDLKEKDTIVINSAAGAVGQVATQLARNKGCKVIGIAGSNEKCEWLLKVAKISKALNYKQDRANFVRQFDSACPEGIDVLFENVGGELFDVSLKRLNVFSRIALCGLISEYNFIDKSTGPKLFRNLLMKRVRLQGFIVSDHLDLWETARREISELILKNQLKWREDVVLGLEKAPEALHKIFDGKNEGKLMIKVSDVD